MYDFKQFKMMGFEEWLEGTKYPASRKNELRKVYHRMNTGKGDFRAKRDKFFVKPEFSKKLSTNPRLIICSSDEYLVRFGPFSKSVEKPFSVILSFSSIMTGRVELRFSRLCLVTHRYLVLTSHLSNALFEGGYAMHWNGTFSGSAMKGWLRNISNFPGENF